MESVIVKDIKVNKGCRRVGEFLYDSTNKSIYFEMPYPFPVKLRITNWEYVEVTPGFKNLPTILTGGINEDFITKELEVLEHLSKGELIIHGSCVCQGEVGLLIVGFPQTGKTYGTYTRVANGWNLISEEYTVIKGSTAYPLRPKTKSCFSRKTLKDSGMKLTPKEDLALLARTIRAKMMPFLFEAVVWKEIEVSGHSVDVTIIQDGRGNRVSADQLTILTEQEYPFMTDYMLCAYAYASGYPLLSLQEKQRKLIREFHYAVNYSTKS